MVDADLVVGFRDAAWRVTSGRRVKRLGGYEVADT